MLKEDQCQSESEGGAPRTDGSILSEESVGTNVKMERVGAAARSRDFNAMVDRPGKVFVMLAPLKKFKAMPSSRD